MKYRGIVLIAEEGHSIQLYCELLDVSTSGFCDWKKRPPSKGGARHKVGKDRVAKPMKEEGIEGRQKKAFAPQDDN